MSENLDDLMVHGIFALVGALLLWTAYKGYREGVARRASDLQNKLLRGFNELWLLRNGIESIMQDGNRSHLKLLSAHSGSSDRDSNIWEQEFKGDQAELKHLLESAPLEPTVYEDLSLAQLEVKLVTVNILCDKLAALRDKYTGIVLHDHREWSVRRDRELWPR